MKYIVVQWKPEKSQFSMSEKCMRVICSNHPRFINASRFDFGFLSIASDQGYSITILPSKETLDIQKWTDLGEESEPK